MSPSRFSGMMKSHTPQHPGTPWYEHCTIFLMSTVKIAVVKFLKPNLFYSFRSSWDYIRVKLTPEPCPIRKVNKRKNHTVILNESIVGRQRTKIAWTPRHVGMECILWSTYSVLDSRLKLAYTDAYHSGIVGPSNTNAWAPNFEVLLKWVGVKHSKICLTSPPVLGNYKRVKFACPCILCQFRLHSLNTANELPARQILLNWESNSRAFPVEADLPPRPVLVGAVAKMWNRG